MIFLAETTFVDMDMTPDGQHPELDISKEKSSWRRRR